MCSRHLHRSSNSGRCKQRSNEPQGRNTAGAFDFCIEKGIFLVIRISSRPMRLFSSLETGMVAVVR